MLNTFDFCLLGGNPAAWDEEVLARVGDGEALVDIQRDQHERGRLSAELVRVGEGWAVRGASSLQGADDETFITPRGVVMGREEALAAGSAWVAADPQNREFFCLRADALSNAEPSL